MRPCEGGAAARQAFLTGEALRHLAYSIVQAHIHLSVRAPWGSLAAKHCLQLAWLEANVVSMHFLKTKLSSKHKRFNKPAGELRRNNRGCFLIQPFPPLSQFPYEPGTEVQAVEVLVNPDAGSFPEHPFLEQLHGLPPFLQLAPLLPSLKDAPFFLRGHKVCSPRHWMGNQYLGHTLSTGFEPSGITGSPVAHSMGSSCSFRSGFAPANAATPAAHPLPCVSWALCTCRPPSSLLILGAGTPFGVEPPLGGVSLETDHPAAWLCEAAAVRPQAHPGQGMPPWRRPEQAILCSTTVHVCAHASGCAYS